MYRICHLSSIPLRKEASDRSEMVSQILFGELAEVIEEAGTWQKVKLEYDEYVGWIDKKQMVTISDDEHSAITSSEQFVSSELIQILSLEGGLALPLLAGSSLPLFNNGIVKFSGSSHKFDGRAVRIDKADTGRWMEFALMYLNCPYLWGGRSPFGIDCSGFTQMVYKLSGIKLNRDASQQALQGNLINMIDESRPGDLAFFDNDEGKIIHVGIIMPNRKIIHASGNVKIDQLDHEGIYNDNQKKYTHRLRLIKRFF